ncbi:lactosylceramide 1,3-N-acetyl-beta-D-glucosaminyltransferase [Talpa occidentalis]|uniref:lactosylceramide 1,3-N-acetyl-beta-D-glucosaminyltransferase n=1 Tax=Talpa occidentalis TaxID=50954 RepID=UPI00188EFCC1|nr:lactosylceramide 1,3-N-acetyl-beta-D-glucosaminyltransferase [Talpa occidentalis]XP_037381075.1 lactosylceramide 1,3-N-acetyl-beta-D-glucosaminyltransferase [Talpa occidentalis]XP_037381076.1 lactosylceramide 1,3-N-acetyl-beta-D-glucosaminyltransferase [Talpa occidentalis]
MDFRMFVSCRRVRRQFFQVIVTSFILCFMFYWVPINNVLSHMKSYSYRYLINSYDFVNESLSLKHSSAKTPHYQYLINHEEKCQNQDVLLLLFIKTAPENHNRRAAIRKTWGNEKYIHSQFNATIKTLFVLGIPSHLQKREELQRKLLWEDQKYEDIIQQDFIDSFYNLTLKLLLQFSWTNNFCPHTKFFMTADDDIFIHMPNLIEYLQSLEQIGVQDFWIGRVHRGAPPIRDKSSKYYVPYEMYQLPAYPDYTAGAAYVISSDVASKVYKASLRLNSSFYIDDVFMGLCANIMRVVPQDHVFFSGEGKTPYHPCIYEKMMTSHGHVQDLQELWKNATDPKVKTISKGFFGQLYCWFTKVTLLCRVHHEDTYPCSAAFV